MSLPVGKEDPALVQKFLEWTAEFAGYHIGTEGRAVQILRQNMLKATLKENGYDRITEMPTQVAHNVAVAFGIAQMVSCQTSGQGQEAPSRASTYVACEPHKVEAYADENGGLHADREEALQANFEMDLSEAVSKLCAPRADHTFTECLRNMAVSNPDMLRILVGDRDVT